jgi:hypothetical protein
VNTLSVMNLSTSELLMSASIPVKVEITWIIFTSTKEQIIHRFLSK